MQMWAGNHISTRGEVRKSPAGDSGFALYVAPSAIEQAVKSVILTHPYKGKDASKDGVPGVTVAPGSHNGYVPEIGGVSLTADPAPTLTVSAGNTVVYVKLTLASGGTMDPGVTPQILAANSIPSDFIATDGSGFCYQTLFYITVTTGDAPSVKCMDNVSGSQAFQLCGTTALYGVI